MKKLVIGTAQLVRQYGISNYSKKKSSKNIFKFLEFCLKNSINSFDTASDYGSEKIIGKYIKLNKVKKIFLSTKITSLQNLNYFKKFDHIKYSLEKSLKTLNVESLDTVYFHDENDSNFFNSNSYKINEIFKSYKINNLGFSIYSKKVFKRLNNNIYVNSLQVPVNILNDEFSKIYSEKKIIARSIFLQGLLINSKIKTKKTFLKKFNEKLMKLATENNIDLYSLCLNYVLKKKNLFKVIVGVDNIAQIKSLLNSKNNRFKINKINKINKLINSTIDHENYSQIIDPRKW
jgi:aryl-alcohol dehydrogenase-like predicted oxidoreductase